MTTRRAEANFESWKRLVGLSDKFPALEPLADFADFDKIFLRSHRHLDAFASLTYRMGNPSLAVMVERGQGCTSIYHHALYEAKQNHLTRRFIPIEVPLGEAYWAAKQQLDIEFIAKYGIFRSLITSQWDRVLPRQHYNDLVNAWEREEELGQHLIVLQKLTEPGKQFDWKELADINRAPDFSVPLEEIVEKLSLSGIRPILLFDTSFSRRGEFEKKRPQRTRQLAASLKQLYNRRLIGGERGISHAIFVDRDTLDQIREGAALSFEYDFIHFARYTPSEIFGMLNKHYSWVMDLSSLPKLGPIRIDKLPLTAILDEEFVTKVFDENKGINEIVDDMRVAILETLDVSWEKVPYRLHL
jgi:hypothetical protein